METRGRFESTATDRPRRWARDCALVVAALGAAVLTGYALGVEMLVTAAPGLKAMSPLTATALIILSAGVLAEGRERPAAARIAFAGALVLGLGLLAMHGLVGEDRAGPSVAEGLFHFDRARAGRTSPATAACIAALALAGLARARAPLANGLASLTLIVAGMAVLGYAYDGADLHALRIFDTIALHTAVGLLLLAMASLLVQPGHGAAAIIAADETGATRRRLAFALLPPVAGWVLLKAIDAGRIGPAAALAFLVAGTVAPLAALILRDGHSQMRLDAAKRAEAARLAAASLDMERRLAEQAAALERAAAERIEGEAAAGRAQRMEAIGQLTGGIAHDFNNLLMALSGNLELMGRRLPEDHPVRRYVQNAMAATQKGAKLTAQLLAFSRRQRLDTRPVEIDPSLGRARELLGQSLGPSIDVTLHLGAAGIWATSDPDQLELAILNLAINARDAMHGEGLLTIESGPTRARFEASATDVDCVAIRVTDTGEGMPPAVAARAIEPFFSTKERGKGTGLGLPQVYGFARQCGGDLRIRSVVGRGTTIEILLPQTDPAPSTANEELAAVDHVAASPDLTRRLVLVVDDDDGVRSTLADALRDVGFDVAEARDGLDCLAKLEVIEPAAAVIDFIMPGMNGAEVARRARQRQPNLPIVFVSGYFDTVALEGIPGAVVLRKPFNVAGLHKSLAAVVS